MRLTGGHRSDSEKESKRMVAVREEGCWLLRGSTGKDRGKTLQRDSGGGTGAARRVGASGEPGSQPDHPGGLKLHSLALLALPHPLRSHPIAGAVGEAARSLQSPWIALVLHLSLEIPLPAPCTSHLPRKPQPRSDNIFPELIRLLPPYLNPKPVEDLMLAREKLSCLLFPVI